jgi:hypothetical protein
MLGQILVMIEKHAKRGLRAIGVMQPPPRVHMTPIVLLRAYDPLPMHAVQPPSSPYTQRRDRPVPG